jgi:hypothetical protein
MSPYFTSRLCELRLEFLRDFENMAMQAVVVVGTAHGINTN